MDEERSDDEEPRAKIERLEAEIEALAAKIENCRKFILVARIAVVCGGLLLAAILLGLLRFNLSAMTAAMAAFLGGFVVWGSNSSTAKEAASELTAAEAERAGLIGDLELQMIDAPRTLH